MIRSELPAAEKELFFSLDEYQSRLRAVRVEMERRGLDALVLTTPENILYLTGYQTPGYYMYQCLLVTSTHDPLLLIRNGEVSNARAYSWLGECLGYLDYENPAGTTAALLAEVGLTHRTIGLEMRSWFLTARVYEDLRQREPDTKWIDASGTVETCRLRKSPTEIEYIRRAARAAEAGMRSAIDATRVGARDNDVAAALSAAMIAAGSEYLSMGPFVAAGKRSTIFHGIWGRNLIEAGQSMNLEVGAVFNRYNAGLMRSVSMGKPSADQEKMGIAAEAANRRLVESIRPGAMTADLHACVDAELRRHGFGPRTGLRCGYSIGLAFPPDWGEGHILSVINEPNVSLGAGMVLHCPLIVKDHRYGAAFSETVLVTETGHEVLTDFERVLFVR
jgi:Xaa-Pro dipeptidase